MENSPTVALESAGGEVEVTLIGTSSPGELVGLGIESACEGIPGRPTSGDGTGSEGDVPTAGIESEGGTGDSGLFIEPEVSGLREVVSGVNAAGAGTLLEIVGGIVTTLVEE